MSNDPFSGPATVGGSGFDLHTALGHLLLFKVTDFTADFLTSSGTGPKIDADVTVLDGPDAGTNYIGAYVFGRYLTGQLRSKVGGMVLGRLGRGTAQPGKSAPWMLSDPTDADRALGLAHINKEKATAAPPF